MKLIRNTTKDVRCKYALVRLDKIRAMSEALHPEATQRRKIEEHLTALEVHGVLEYGEKGSEEEFFAIKLKDMNAPAALDAYANAASKTDEELAIDVYELFERSRIHPSRKRPD